MDSELKELQNKLEVHESEIEDFCRNLKEIIGIPITKENLISNRSSLFDEYRKLFKFDEKEKDLEFEKKLIQQEFYQENFFEDVFNK